MCEARLEAAVFTPESPRPWGGPGGARAGGGAGPALPARGRASTPAGAAADPPESILVIHRPFSEMMPARERGKERGTRGCGEMPPGPGIPGVGTPPEQPGVFSPPGRRSEHAGDRDIPPAGCQGGF